MKTKILESYIRLCHEIGAANITQAKLAKKAGLALSSVHYYFGKEKESELNKDAIDYFFNYGYLYLENFLSEERKSEQYHPLIAYTQAMHRLISTKIHYGSFFVYYYYLCSCKGSPYSEQNSNYLMKAHHRIEALLHESVGRKKIKEVSSPLEIAKAIHQIILGSILTALTYPLEIKKRLEKNEKDCVEFIETLLSR